MARYKQQSEHLEHLAPKRATRYSVILLEKGMPSEYITKALEVVDQAFFEGWELGAVGTPIPTKRKSLIS